MERFSDRGSIPLASTRWTLHEHLLFQRRLCRKGVAVMSKQNQRAKVLMCLGPLFYILVPDWDSAPNHNRQTAASNASVNTHSPFLLVGTMSQTPPNAEFILRLRVLQTLFVPYALFWGHGVSLCLSLRLLLQICPIG